MAEDAGILLYSLARKLAAVHRCGLAISDFSHGNNIVLVVTASSHRRAAFDAAEFLMDFLKTRAPFWKREHLTDGSVGDWVEAQGEDAAAAERWAVSSS